MMIGCCLLVRKSFNRSSGSSVSLKLDVFQALQNQQYRTSLYYLQNYRINQHDDKHGTETTHRWQ
jgi:hypothetical protein